MDEQRKRVYGYRQNILDGANCKQLILEMIDQQIDHYLDQFLDKDYGTETFAEWAGKQLAVEFDAARLPRHGLRRRPSSSPRDEAERMAEGQVLDAIEENLPEEEDAARMELGGAGQAGQHPLAPQPPRPRPEARSAAIGWASSSSRRPARPIGKIDLSEGARFLEPDFGVQHGLRLGAAQVRHRARRPTRSASWSRRAFKQLVREKARGGLRREGDRVSR